jgi:hypothetical protein
MTLDECLTVISRMMKRRPDVAALQQHLRLSRLRLGSAIEQLESLEARPDAFAQLCCHAESIAVEIEALGESIRQFSHSNSDS